MIYKWIVIYWDMYNNHQALKIECDAFNLMMTLQNNNIILDNILSIAKEVEIKDMTYQQPPQQAPYYTDTTNKTTPVNDIF
jgi:hypothetical protein